MRSILFYGDSNTWGYDPRDGSRYPYEKRWTSVCAAALGSGFCCIPAGMNGRTTVFDNPLKGCRNGLDGLDYALQSHKPLDLVTVMLGTNDLGYFPWEMFLDDVETILGQFHKLQPKAVIYICSVIYVDESKTTTDYVNNENVITVNKYLLEACEDLDYCRYINLNEMFNNGYNTLLPEASQDGVHLYEKYTKMMLQFLKNHYI